jgi:hypothetical protein
MSDKDFDEGLNKITTTSIKSKIKKFFEKIKTFLLSRPKRIFLKGSV